MVRVHLGQPHRRGQLPSERGPCQVVAGRGRSSIGRAPGLQPGGRGFESHRLHHIERVAGGLPRGASSEKKFERSWSQPAGEFTPGTGRRPTCSLTSWVGGKRSSRISSENQIKLERVYVRMPRHQEPTKDVAKLRKVSGRRKRSKIRECPRFGNDTR